MRTTHHDPATCYTCTTRRADDQAAARKDARDGAILAALAVVATILLACLTKIA